MYNYCSKVRWEICSENFWKSALRIARITLHDCKFLIFLEENMKKLAILFSVVLAVILATGIAAADPLISIDFANGAGDVELVDADIVEDATRGKVLQISGMGANTTGQSYGLLETTVFEDNSWEDGLTISMWIKTDVGSTTLKGTAPIFSLDIANVGYIAMVTSLESAINTDGNDTALGISPRCWNDPANVSGGVNKTEEGVWQQLTVVYAPDGMKVYVNGELYSEPVINNCTMDDFLFQVEFVYSLRLGSWLCSWWNYGDYEGMMDDIYVYNIALDADEVADLYTSTKVEQTTFEEAPALEDIYSGEWVDPIYTLDFESADGIELTNAEIADGVLKVNGTGDGTCGTSYAVVPTDLFQTTDWQNGMTIALWVNPNVSDTLKGNAPLYSLDIANQGYIAAVASLESAINTDGNEDVGISPRMWNDPANTSESVSALKAGEWQQVIVVYDEQDMAIYLNGEVVVKPVVNGGAMSDLFTQIQQVYSLRLGSWLCSWWNQGDFEGQIDNVQIFNTALNPLQAKNLYEGKSEETAATEAPAATTEVEEAPAVIETVETPAASTTSDTAPQTFDAAIIAFAVSALSAGAAVISKKRR